MKVTDFNYELPRNLIAREPREYEGKKRSDSRMIVMDRQNGMIYHKSFNDIINYMHSGDILVLNNSKTIKANLVGSYNGRKKIEIDLCCKRDRFDWLCYIQFDTFVRVGGKVSFSSPSDDTCFLTGKIIGQHDNQIWLIRFEQEDVIDIANQIGRPIISYYFKERCDIKYLQNTYSTVDGSSELPAAGRHFDDELLQKIQDKGISVVYITLHTGLSSINVETENFEDFKMHEEFIEITPEVADIINQAKRNGHKIIGTGTTVMRTLESCSDKDGALYAYRGFTDLYIYEGFQFKIVDKFITNFHAPKSTRIALAATFSGKELLLKCYNEAIKNEYLFYEFGDATFTI